MLSTNFKPKRTAPSSRGWLVTARFSCNDSFTYTFTDKLRKKQELNSPPHLKFVTALPSEIWMFNMSVTRVRAVEFDTNYRTLDPLDKISRRAPLLSYPYPSPPIPFKGLNSAWNVHVRVRILLHTEHKIQYCHAVDFVGLSGYFWTRVRVATLRWPSVLDFPGQSFFLGPVLDATVLDLKSSDPSLENQLVISTNTWQCALFNVTALCSVVITDTTANQRLCEVVNSEQWTVRVTAVSVTWYLELTSD